jgi:hypothetical protein
MPGACMHATRRRNQVSATVGGLVTCTLTSGTKLEGQGAVAHDAHP